MTASICIAFGGRAMCALAGPRPESEEDDDVFLDDDEEDSGDV